MTHKSKWYAVNTGALAYGLFNLPRRTVILLSAYYEMPERILWSVDDYVMKSEMPERLIPIIERAHRLGPHSDEPRRSRQAAVC